MHVLNKSVFSSFVFFISLLVILSGCQTTGTTNLEGTDEVELAEKDKPVSLEFYSLFYDQGDHLKDFIEEKDFEKAAKLFAEQKAFFAENMKAQKEALSKVADHYNDQHLPDMQQALDRVSAISWPAPMEKWAVIKSDLQSASAAIRAYPDHAILHEPELELSQLPNLKDELGEIESAITSDAEKQFIAFNHFGDLSFHEGYPVSVDMTALFDTRLPDLLKRMSNATLKELSKFTAIYTKEDVGAHNWNRIGEIFISAHLRKSDGGNDAQLANILKAVTAAKAAGFSPSIVPGFKFGFVEVTSKTLLKEGQIQYAAEINMDLPFDTVKSEIDTAFTDPKTLSSDYLIVFDVALAKASRRVTRSKKVPSKILTGYKKEPNPEYNVLQNDINTSRMNVQSAAMNFSMVNNQYCYGIACLGKLGSQFAAAAKKKKAQEALDEQMGKLSTTPMNLDIPMYAKYNYNLTTIKGTKTMTVHYYVIDKQKKRYFKSTFDVIEKKNFEVAYNVEDEDPDKDNHFANADSEETVDVWEDQASKVNISHLIEHYLSNKQDSKPLSTMEALRKEILKDKNTALAKLTDETFEGSTRDDPRFDSVVAIYRGNSLGTGFFVRPDVVMTNYHVVEEGKFVELKMNDGQETFGKVIAKDVRLDLALVRVQTRGKPVTFYSDRKLDLGKTVEVIGHPRGLEFSITRGVVSAVRKMKPINIRGSDKVLHVQIDAPTSPGNSGGPVFLKDKVISIVSWGRTDRGSENLNFTIHYSEALKFLKESLRESS